MAYLVFARKWRPKDFDEIVGQEHVTRTLKSAIESGKLGHAYLFAGPQGVGKTSCARILAKSLNCARGSTSKPCGECSACREIAEGRSLDIIEIDGASNRGIDEIRTLRDNVKFAPLNGRVKIYIIDEVHMLTSEAFNALLKTLEEPPPYVKFILATTHPQKVPPTILSRCQRFDFSRIAYLKIVDKLKDITAKESLTIDEEALFAIARASDGSLRDSESILDQLVSFSQGGINPEDVISVLGVIQQEAFFDFVDCVTRADAQKALELIQAIVTQGKELAIFLDGLLGHYRNLMVARVMPSGFNAFVDVSESVHQRLLSQAQSVSLSEIMSSIQQVLSAQDLARKLNSARIPTELLAVRLCFMEGRGGSATTGVSGAQKNASGALKDVVQFPVDRPAQTLKKENVVAPRADVVRAEPNRPEAERASGDRPWALSLSDVEAQWGQLIQRLSEVKMSLGTYLKEAIPLKSDEKGLTIGFPKTAVFYKEAMAHGDNLKIFENVIRGLWGGCPKVDLEISERAVVGHIQQEPVSQSAPPNIQSALDMFQGKIISRE